MGCFSQAITVVLTHEGGFSNHGSDPGGATNYGISLRWLKSQALYGDFDDDGDVDIDDILAIDHETAVRIYREKWWNHYGYDRIVDCGVATKLMDMSVNMGGRQAHRLLQRAVNAMGGQLQVDGVIGPLTRNAVNTADPVALVDEMRAEQKRFYSRLITKRPALAVFRRGWMRRAAA